MKGPCPVAASWFVLPAPPLLHWSSFVGGTGHQCGQAGRIWSVSPHPTFHDAWYPAGRDLVPSKTKQTPLRGERSKMAAEDAAGT